MIQAAGNACFSWKRSKFEKRFQPRQPRLIAKTLLRGCQAAEFEHGGAARLFA
jgi:hypothetical protein